MYLIKSAKNSFKILQASTELSIPTPVNYPLIIAILLSLNFINLNAQVTLKFYRGKRCVSRFDSAEARPIYLHADTMPQFPGGSEAMGNFIRENKKRPVPSEGWLPGTVLIDCVVEPSGEFSKLEVICHLSKKADEEATRVIEMMPKWIPGYCGGVRVPVEIIIPVYFRGN